MSDRVLKGHGTENDFVVLPDPDGSVWPEDRLDEAQEAFTAADTNFEQLSSISHRAAAWVAQGDLATRRGDDRAAAHLYRKAAEALQDVRF